MAITPRRRECLLFSVDLARDDKQVCISAEQQDFATILLCDPDGVPHMASLKTQPFGSRRAPANWGRVTSFVQCVLRNVCAVWLAGFAVDCFSAEPVGNAITAIQATKEVGELLGASLSDGEEVHPCSSMLLLGAMVTIQGDTAFASLPERKLVEYRGLLGGCAAIGQAYACGRGKAAWQAWFRAVCHFRAVWPIHAK